MRVTCGEEEVKKFEEKSECRGVRQKFEGKSDRRRVTRKGRQRKGEGWRGGQRG